MNKTLCLALLQLMALAAFGQPDSSSLQLSGYVEAFYSYDLGQPERHRRQDFLYSHNRHNEFNLNLGLVKLAYASPAVRANVALMAGTYPQQNMAAEPAALRNVFEANAGVKLSRQRALWVDAGIFPSHIGFESAIGKDCWNLTRSVLAENSPYFESGAKLTYGSDNGKWTASALLLNGWQRIYRPVGNNSPAFGHQLIYKPNASLTLNSSSFVGNDQPDSVSQARLFHNFYGIWQASPRWGITAGFDIGAQQAAHASDDYHLWYSPVLILKWQASTRASLAARGEYYSDPEEVIIATANLGGFQTWGSSLNFDYAIRPNVLWRLEGRAFWSQYPLFEMFGDPSQQNVFFTTALMASF